MKRIFLAAALYLIIGSSSFSQTQTSSSAASTDDLYQMGKSLFDAYAPDEVKKDYEFPSKHEWDSFIARFQETLQGGSLEQLAGYEDEARAALVSLPVLLNTTDYNPWLQGRLDYSDAAKQIVRAKEPPKSSIPPPVAYYNEWLARMQGRPKPHSADSLVPKLKAVFEKEKVSPSLVWVAETESGLDPRALSPAGAKGLFQLMPATARARGLSTLLPDERTDPDKSAHAAAQELRSLHERFGSWPLALAAYNAGEGRVSRLLTASSDHTYNGIAEKLPVETRMYVPKVLATIAVRENRTPASLESGI